jgi:hypothetical protein
MFGSLVVELAFDGERLRFWNLELFLVRVLILYAPGVGILRFFLLVLQQCSSERGMLDILPLAGFLLWC